MSIEEAKKEIKKMIDDTPIEQLIFELRDCGAKIAEKTSASTGKYNISYGNYGQYGDLSVYIEFDGQAKKSFWSFRRKKDIGREAA